MEISVWNYKDLKRADGSLSFKIKKTFMCSFQCLISQFQSGKYEIRPNWSSARRWINVAQSRRNQSQEKERSSQRK